MPGLLPLIAEFPTIFAEGNSNGEGIEVNQVESEILGPVPLDTQYELLTIISNIGTVEVEIRGKLNEQNVRIFPLIPTELKVAFTFSITVGGITCFYSSADITLQRSGLFFAAAGEIVTRYKALNIVLGSDIVNPILVLTGQSIYCKISLSYSTLLLPTTTIIKELEGEKEVEKSIEYTQLFTEPNLAVRNNIISTIISREVSTLPDHSEETAPPRRVV